MKTFYFVKLSGKQTIRINDYSVLFQHYHIHGDK